MQRVKYYVIALLVLIIAMCCSGKDYFRVYTETMLPAIEPDEYVKLDYSSSKFGYGDIVLCSFGDSPEYLFRVVALPGDRISVDEDICIVNGQKNKSRFVRKEGVLDVIEETLPNGLRIEVLYQMLMCGNSMSELQLGEDQYFVMGDNRSGQCDSRYFGPVSVSEIYGIRAKVIEIKQ